MENKVQIPPSMINDYLRKTIRSLTFTHSINWSEVVEILFENNERLDKETRKENMSPEDRTNCYKRLYTLTDRLNLDIPEYTPKSRLDSPKIYDDAIFNNGVKLYNVMAELLDWPTIETILSDNTILSYGPKEELTTHENFYSMAELMFPYAFVGERHGATFFETIILSILYTCVHHHKRLEKLNQVPTEKDQEYIKALQNRIKERVFTPSYVNSLIRTFFHKFEEVVYEDLLTYQHKLYAEVLLQDKYRNRKNILRAAKNRKHFRETDEINSYTDYIIITTHLQLKRMYDVILPLSEYLLNNTFTYIIDYSTIPLKEILNIFGEDTKKQKDELLLNFYINNKKPQISNEEYDTAAKLAWSVNLYISKALAGALLSTELPELQTIF